MPQRTRDTVAPKIHFIVFSGTQDPKILPWKLSDPLMYINIKMWKLAHFVCICIDFCHLKMIRGYGTYWVSSAASRQERIITIMHSKHDFNYQLIANTTHHYLYPLSHTTLFWSKPQTLYFLINKYFSSHLYKMRTL